MKVKAKLKKGVVNVKALAKHPMMTYNQAEKKLGNREEANFITHVSAQVGDKVVFDMSTSQFLSKNPIFKFKFKGDFKKGDKLVMGWIDKKGKSGSGNTKIK